MARASWENNLKIERFDIPFDGANPPYQYLEVWMNTFSNLGDYLQGLTDPNNPEKLIALTFQASVTSVDRTNGGSCGFLAAGITYGSPNPDGVTNRGVTRPPLPPGGAGLKDFEDSVAYDAVPLPSGGVEYPVWTRTATDKLRANVYPHPDKAGPGTLWTVAIVQITASVTDAKAAQVAMAMGWEEVDQ